jgi:hypothetical protein
MKLTLINQMPDHRHLQMRFLLPEGWVVNPNDRADALLLHKGTKSVEFEVTPGERLESVTRGAIEVVAVGRPTAGYLPLVFIAGN